MLCFVLTLLPTAFADNIIGSGECGDNLTWKLDSNGTLTISGTGEIEEYCYWDGYKDQIISAVICDGVTSIGRNAFSSCESLTSVTIPGSVTSIGDEAFHYCSSLESVKFSEGLKLIGEWAFSVCENLTTAKFPNSLKSIGDGAFVGCSSLQSVVIPGGVTSIGNSFYYCDSLKSINVSESNSTYSSKDGVLFNKNKTKLLTYPAGKTDTSYAIPGSVTSIEGNAFKGCERLTSVNIPNSVKEINDEAFWGCSSLKSITIPDSVSSIGSGAFRYCTSLTSATIPNSVKLINDEVFYECSALKSISVPNSVTIIGGGAFSYCASLTSVTIPSSVKQISSSAFRHCENLKSVSIPDSVSSIGLWAFMDCSSLTSITIPNSVSTISYRTFHGCDSLKSVTIPTSVKSIEPSAFSDCGNLSDVYYKGTASQWKSIDISDSDNDAFIRATIHYVASTPAAPALKVTTSAGKPKIYWNAVNGAVKYWIYRSTDGKNFKYYDSTTKTSYTNKSTSIGTTYYYKLKAVNVVDGKNYASAYSVSKGIQCKPAAPTVSINRSNGKPKLSWKAVTGATKYWIYRSTDGVNFKYFDSTTKTSYTNSGAASGKKYYYRVKAVAVVKGKNVISANSSTKSLMTTLATPSVSITTSNGKPKLTWKAVTGADKYYVYRSTDGKTFKYFDSTTKTTYINSGAAKNTKYYYKVKAVCASNSNANSAQSSTVSIKATK